MESLYEQVLREQAEPEINRRLLIIDDNPAIHEDIRKILGRGPAANRTLDDLEESLFGAPARKAEAEGFVIDSAHQGAEGLELVRRAQQQGRPYAMAIVDMRMPPGWDGVETIEHLWREQPELQIVICTAYSDHSWLDIVARLGTSHNLLVLKKPFEPIELLQLAHTLTQKWSLQRQVAERLAALEGTLKRCVDELDAAHAVLRQEVERSARLEAALAPSGGGRHSA